MNRDKMSLDRHEVLSASKEIVALDAWINQHLEERERRLSGSNPFIWHQPSANDLKPSTSLDITPQVDVDQPIEFK